MRTRKTTHHNYMDVDMLIEFLEKHKGKKVHSEDLLRSLFYELQYSFGFKYRKFNEGEYEPEAIDIILYYAIQHHNLESNYRFLYRKKWYKNLYYWYEALNNEKYRIPKKIKFSTLDKRIELYKKLDSNGQT